MTTSEGRSRGPYARTKERRQVIARAVLDLVLEKGHANVTTAEVAQRAATSEGTVLYHFPTRDHLLVAALQCSDDEDDERTPAGNGAQALDVDTALKAFTRAAPHRENIMRLYTALAGHATTPEHPAQDYFRAHHQAAIARFSRLMEQRQAAGLAHPGLDASEVARQFVATWDGLQAQWLVDPSFDLGDLLVGAFRRLSGQNWMEARALMLASDIGM